SDCLPRKKRGTVLHGRAGGPLWLPYGGQLVNRDIANLAEPFKVHIAPGLGEEDFHTIAGLYEHEGAICHLGLHRPVGQKNRNQFGSLTICAVRRLVGLLGQSKTPGTPSTSGGRQFPCSTSHAGTEAKSGDSLSQSVRVSNSRRLLSRNIRVT